MRSKALLLRRLFIACAVLTFVGAQARAATIEWKGVTWDLSSNGTAVVNPNGSLTLTITNGTGSGIAWLHVNRLPWGGGTFETVMDPWVRWSFEGHKGDILIDKEGGLNPTIQAGSLWDRYWAATRYTTALGARSESYLIYSDPTEGVGSTISHVVNLGKGMDGTVDAGFDSGPWATSEFLKTNVGANWGFQDVYLRLRAGNAGDTITFTDFQYGSGYIPIPEPVTMALLGLAATGLGGYVRKRRKHN
jgi:hypothetical protein